MKLTSTTVRPLLVSTAGPAGIKSKATNVPVRRSSRETTASTGLMTVRRTRVSSELALMEATTIYVFVSRDITGPTATRTLMIVKRSVKCFIEINQVDSNIPRIVRARVRTMATVWISSMMSSVSVNPAMTEKSARY